MPFLPRFLRYALLFVYAAFFLALCVYFILGRSLGYCLAEGDCSGWVALRALFVTALLARLPE